MPDTLRNVPCRRCRSPVEQDATKCAACGEGWPGLPESDDPAAHADRMQAIARERARDKPPAGQPVYITGVRIPFGDMVLLILTFALASIPALIILWILMGIAAALFIGVSI